MTTNEWDRVCATVFTWRHGHRTVRLNMPAISDVCGGAWQVYWTGGTTKEAGHTRAGLIAYCEREGITLPPLPEEWCPEPVEEPAKPYSLADDPRLREVVRTKWGGLEWDHWPDWTQLRAPGGLIASIYPDGRWFAYPGERGDFCGRLHGRTTNPANAYDECMAALRDLGSLAVDEPDADADAGMVQPPTLRDRLLNLADRMWFSDKPAASFAFELRDLARGLSGGER